MNVYALQNYAFYELQISHFLFYKVFIFSSPSFAANPYPAPGLVKILPWLKGCCLVSCRWLIGTLAGESEQKTSSSETLLGLGRETKTWKKKKKENGWLVGDRRCNFGVHNSS